MYIYIYIKYDFWGQSRNDDDAADDDDNGDDDDDDDDDNARYHRYRGHLSWVTSTSQWPPPGRKHGVNGLKPDVSEHGLWMAMDVYGKYLNYRDIHMWKSSALNENAIIEYQREIKSISG